MVKGKLLTSLASVAVLGGVALGSVNVFAAEAPGSGAETDVTVGFGNYTEPPGPGDGDGILSLRHVPRVMDFGSNNTAGNTQTLQGTTNGADYAMIRDDRQDAGQTEWKLSAKASELTATDNSSIITNGKIKMNSTSAIKDWAPSSVDPMQPTLLNDRTEPSVTRASNMELPLDGTTSDTLASTPDAGSRGYYALPIDNLEMEVTSNASQAGKQFAGTVTWTLEDTV